MLSGFHGGVLTHLYVAERMDQRRRPGMCKLLQGLRRCKCMCMLSSRTPVFHKLILWVSPGPAWKISCKACAGASAGNHHLHLAPPVSFIWPGMRNLQQGLCKAQKHRADTHGIKLIGSWMR